MDNVQKSTSPRWPSALPDEWVERIFQRMENFYLSLWKDRFGDIPRERVKRAWAEELAGYSAAEIKRGLDVCRKMKFPPTLPEFLTACRPPIDPRADWMEACEQMRIRLQGKGEDRWSRPQVYWAAVAIGQFDLNQNSWEQIRARWEKALIEAKSDPIPEYRAALPKPGQATTSREEAGKRLREIADKTGISISTTGIGDTKWAVRLAEREAAGESLSSIQSSYWREAMGVPHEASAKEVLGSMAERAAA